MGFSVLFVFFQYCNVVKFSSWMLLTDVNESDLDTCSIIDSDVHMLHRRRRRGVMAPRVFFAFVLNVFGHISVFARFLCLSGVLSPNRLLRRIKACFALHNFGEQFEGQRDVDSNALSPYLSPLVQKLLMATQREDGRWLLAASPKLLSLFVKGVTGVGV